MNYDNYSYPLIEAGQNVVNEMLATALFLNQAAIESPNPENLNRYQSRYNSEVEKISNEFDNNYKNWLIGGFAFAYIAGLKNGEKQLKQFGLNSSISNNISQDVGTSLLLKNFDGGSISPTVVKMFDKYPEHASLFNAFQNAVNDPLQNQKFQIIRKGNDIFRDVAIMAGNEKYKDGDIFTRKRLSQTLLNKYAQKGIQTVTYRNGQRFSIDSYCEMVGRTMTNRAGIQATMNRLYQSGYNLVVVSAHFRACDLCTPYEGVTLCMERHPTYESIADAELQGLFHPNCKHDISIWWEGRKDIKPSVDPAEQKLIDQYGYNEAQEIAYTAQMKQRAIERKIRNWKRRESIALDKESKEKARNKISHWQKKQREHLKSNLFLPRKYQRESI